MTNDERLIYAAAYVHGGKTYAHSLLSGYRADVAAARRIPNTVGNKTLLEFAESTDAPEPCPGCRAISLPLPDGKCRGCGFQRAKRS